MANLPADLSGLNLLILNVGELHARVGRNLNTEADIAAACREVHAQGVRRIIVTRGAQGVLYSEYSEYSDDHDGKDNGGSLSHIPAPAVTVRDVTGAGDSFSAAVCWSLYHAPDDLGLAARRGVALSALTVQSEQSVLPDLHADLLESVD